MQTFTKKKYKLKTKFDVNFNLFLILLNAQLKRHIQQIILSMLGSLLLLYTGTNTHTVEVFQDLSYFI